MFALRPSLQRRLLSTVLGLVAIVWIGAAVSTWIDVRHELDELLDGHLAQAAAILVVQQADDLDAKNHGFDTPSLHRYAPKVIFQVFSNGRLLMHSANAPADPLGPVDASFKPGFNLVRKDGSDWRVFGTAGATTGTVVYVGEEVASRDSILWAVIRSSMLPMAIALPALALLLWVAIRSGLNPLRQLGDILKNRHANALEVVEIQAAPSEIVPVVDSLNNLFHRIQQLLESERRFTADASHELRTPIAAIRAQAQVAQLTADHGLRKNALQFTLEGCDRAAHVVDQLLTLSRLENASLPQMDSIDLAVTTRQVLADLTPNALAKNQSLEFVVDSECEIRANSTLLSILLRNLFDNAIRYSPQCSQILIDLKHQDEFVILTVQDGGPGMVDSDLNRLGERFFRGSSQTQSGSGLGWSIVRRVAAVHGFSIQVTRSRDLGGLAVKLSINSPKQRTPMRDS